jgi:ubiquitin-protein ligase
MSASTNPAVSSPRLRRLYADLAAMIEMVKASELVTMTHSGNPPDRYHVTYACRGLFWPAGAAEPQISTHHEADFYLHRDYPRRPPQIVWRTPIFHPNILSSEQGGGVCIGSWTPSESLADLVVRVGEMVQYREYNADDVLNREAALWVEAHSAQFPVDDRPLVVYGL